MLASAWRIMQAAWAVTASGLVGIEARLGRGSQRFAGAGLGGDDQDRDFSFGGILRQQVGNGGRGPLVTR